MRAHPNHGLKESRRPRIALRSADTAAWNTAAGVRVATPWSYMARTAASATGSRIGNGVWRWSFHPSGGRPRSGRVVGDRLWAVAEACRAIEIWRAMITARAA